MDVGDEPLGQPFVILYVGRFDRRKIEHDRLPMLDLVQAVAQIRDQAPCLRIFYIGQGTPEIEEALGTAIEAHGVSDLVTLLGPKSHIAPYARSAHLGVGAIGLNGVAQDFLMQSTPQLLMDTPENRDTPWRDGRNVLMVKPGDLGQLTSKLLWAISHRESLPGLAERAREDFDEYVADTRSGGRVYLAAFQQLIDENSRSLGGTSV